jgi:hypothetical protein
MIWGRGLTAAPASEGRARTREVRSARTSLRVQARLRLRAERLSALPVEETPSATELHVQRTHIYASRGLQVTEFLEPLDLPPGRVL